MGLPTSAAILKAQSFKHQADILVISQHHYTSLLECRDDNEDDESSRTRRTSTAGRKKKNASPEAEEEPEIVLDESSTWKPLQHAKLPAVLDFLHGIAASASSKKPLKMLPTTAKLRATLLLHREKVLPWRSWQCVASAAAVPWTECCSRTALEGQVASGLTPVLQEPSHPLFNRVPVALHEQKLASVRSARL